MLAATERAGAHITQNLILTQSVQKWSQSVSLQTTCLMCVKLRSGLSALGLMHSCQTFLPVDAAAASKELPLMATDVGGVQLQVDTRDLCLVLWYPNESVSEELLVSAQPAAMHEQRWR